MVEFLYFKDSEFRKAMPSCSLSDMDYNFMFKLCEARRLAGIPFVINSAFRTKEYEISKGRAGTSSHCKGVAVDIACSDSGKRLTYVASAIASGIKRIGIGKNFIHLDCDPGKEPAIWLYL